MSAAGNASTAINGYYVKYGDIGVICYTKNQIEANAIIQYIKDNYSDPLLLGGLLNQIPVPVDPALVYATPL
jgi:hypothetical protein